MVTPIYVISGQSNAVRLGASGQLEAALRERGIDAEVITSGQGARSLGADPDRTDFFPFDDGDPNTGELFRDLLQDVRDAVGSTPGGYVKSFLWVQGERDANIASLTPDYKENLVQLAMRLREEFGEDFNFTIQQLSDEIPAADGSGSDRWDEIRRVQQEVADELDFVTLINPDEILPAAGLTFTRPGTPDSSSTDGFGDFIHFNDAGYEAIANAYLDQFPDNQITGNNAANRLSGSGRADDIFGGSGNDVIFGRGGNDYLVGGNGNDRVSGNAGNDFINGGSGNDTINGGGGRDELLGNSGADRLFGGSGNDTLYGGIGNDFLQAGTGNDRLFGDDGADRLEGREGADFLNGGGGNDFLLGGSGADRLFGSAGNDRLNGGNGNDLLVGGGGSDTFIFNEGSGRDIIRDFQNNIDELDLRDFDFANRSQALSNADFRGGNVVFEFNDGSELVVQDITIAQLTDDVII